MKKLSAIILAMLMLVSVVAMSGCGAKAENVKLGMGVYTTIGEAKAADGETNGECEVNTTAAAVLVSADGKIVSCVIDAADAKLGYTSSGEVVVVSDVKTKHELGANYGMVAYGGAKLEWDAQTEVFCNLVVGKTIDEVKAMVVDGYKGNDEVINAGCTIGVAEFVKAVEKAYANATEGNATTESKLTLAINVFDHSSKNASEEANGVNEVEVIAVVAALDTEGKVADIAIDSCLPSVSFDMSGVGTSANGVVTTKRELGTNYNMAAYGADLNGDGVVKEWFEQANALEDACLGLTASEVEALVVNGYGVESLQTAGCTIGISTLVSTVVKALNN